MPKVLLGMSGGVDSSVCAYLLKEQGYDVVGVTIQFWGDLEDEGCGSIASLTDAKKVAEKLNIPHYVYDYRAEFKNKVIDNFVEAYFNGQTPNPCVICNRLVKFESMLEIARRLNCDLIATGHYANVTKHPDTNRYTLQTADNKKDQTYALYNLTQEQLSKTVMPVGNYDKDTIRSIAEKIGLDVANKPDSQEICFIPDNDYATYIMNNSDKNCLAGDFVDMQGNVLGKHKGIINYTIGQRKGLGIAFGVPMYVCGINKENNQVILGENENLFSREVRVKDFNYMSHSKIEGRVELLGKIRYSQQKSPCILEEKDGIVYCTFKDKQRAITPGQSAVFYDRDYVFGGGIII